MRLDISVVVPVRDGAGFLPGLFAALEAQTLAPERFEVVLVDDGSTDATPTLARDWAASHPARRRVVAGNGAGPARARNLGIRSARGTWVASTDCDVTIGPAWLETGLAALERTGANALEGAIDELPSSTTAPYTTRQTNLSGGRYMTGNMIYRRDLLERLGGFDERFAQQFLEDSDLAFRILDAGHEIPFAPDVRVSHPVAPRSAVEALRSVSKLRWLALFARKHPRRYRTQLRPIVRPLTSSDIDVLLGLLAGVGAIAAGGFPRIVLVLVALNGIRRGLGSGRLHGATVSELPSRVVVSLLVPPLRAFWWLAGCIRFRRFVW